jgi:hypothetical protein
MATHWTPRLLTVAPRSPRLVEIELKRLRHTGVYIIPSDPPIRILGYGRHIGSVESLMTNLPRAIDVATVP